ncbi:hypothetical protein GCM10010328_09360 [Streptomyces rubiginosohelvolus]|uniref:Uncharacterized protein n=1 Tax=Streptomyces rubiginosohelvolus TaxID=67362 RepID=A0ABQ3BGH0_9ACTN|nr:hypothetical protein GCM10010328_09360 [Streptomyces pluricolorescens]
MSVPDEGAHGSIRDGVRIFTRLEHCAGPCPAAALPLRAARCAVTVCHRCAAITACRNGHFRATGHSERLFPSFMSMTLESGRGKAAHLAAYRGLLPGGPVPPWCPSPLGGGDGHHGHTLEG